ncbi:L-aspartate oxidase [[Clostridium] fimetarium]|uniref:L-aspartate oxidase n=1 Tax=[Clostridium] fimetarium TaxID=99656 RepID=A0A1I0MGT0_9FIRM|nr:L-aspartate oxidase [[Clostridium] fimetarium]SEV86970.1 L-aspartate oxidase [[Clostridium] fimetarium]
MERKEYDVIIVGTGAAGLFTAISFPVNYKILMITKDTIENSDSYLAQGGISTLLRADDYNAYYEDTMKAGHFENRPESVEKMIRSSNGIIQQLIKVGVDFDKNEAGQLDYTREGGHSTYRILHHQDVTGKEIVSKLLTKVRTCKNITILENTTMVDIVAKDNECQGIVMKDFNGISACYGKSIILATGGIGGVFKNSTNFPHISGDSFAIALRHKIKLENIDYIQIHPTVLYSKKKGRRFLISESVRGEGAVLLNEDKNRFVDELQPRDVVTEAISKEMKKYNTDHVYLCLKNISKKEILSHFPNIYKRCLEEGYDATKDLIPVTPAQHYLMGGIKVNTIGETSMSHLFAVGETACNGVHGANRLASNSLLESLVFGQNTAQNICKNQVDTKIVVSEVQIKDYNDIEKWQQENVKILLNEIKRRDVKFYDKWCNA